MNNRRERTSPHRQDPSLSSTPTHASSQSHHDRQEIFIVNTRTHLRLEQRVSPSNSFTYSYVEFLNPQRQQIPSYRDLSTLSPRYIRACNPWDVPQSSRCCHQSRVSR